MNPLDSVASIKITLHANGAIDVAGNIGDVKLALGMLDAARDAVKHQVRDRNQIIIPNRDVDAQQSPAFPSLPLGDMRPEDRGDQ
jgi:hypothetical protein